MKSLILPVACITASLFVASCSCYEVAVHATEAEKVGLPIGTVLEARKNLFGQLQPHIDDGHKFIAISEVQLYKKHYVLKEVAIPAGTRFRIKSFTRPRNPLCSGIDAVLEPITPIDPAGVDWDIDLKSTGNGTYGPKPEMFSVQPVANGG